jgi:hypothetical protein
MVDIQIGTNELTPDLMTKASRMPPLPAGTYEFQVDDITPGNTQNGRPKWTVWLKILNNPQFPNARLPYNCNLPWVNPETGGWDISGSFSIVDLMKGTKKEWIGDFKKPEVQEDYRVALMGATGFMRVGQRQNRLDPTIMENTIRVVGAKR